MFRFRYFKKFILSTSLAGGLTRPNELPVYDDNQQIVTSDSDQSEEGAFLEDQIGKIRQEVWVWYDHVKGYREKVVEVVVTSKEHSAGLIQSLRNDELPIPRSGAIAISGLAGFILGLRGGWFKRIVYGSTCAGIMAAICYPRETSEISQEALGVAKKYVLISYNFIYGGEKTQGSSPTPVRIYDATTASDDPATSDNPDDLPIVHPTNPCSPPYDFFVDSATAEQQKGSCSDSILTDRLVEEAADVTYWGFRLGEKTTPRQNDQSNPADKDLYTNRK